MPYLPLLSSIAVSGSKFLRLRSLCARPFSSTAPPSVVREVSATLSHPDWRSRLESSDMTAKIDGDLVYSVLLENKQSEDPERLLDFFKWSKTVAPSNLHSFSILAVILGNAKLPGLAKAVVQQLVDTGEPAPQVLDSIVKTSCSGTSAGSEIFEILISIYKKRGCLDEACSVFLGVSKEKGLQFPSLAFCNSFLSYLLRLNRVDMIWKVYEAMSVASLVPDNKTYSAMIKGCYEAGYSVKACEVLNEMRNRNSLPTYFTYFTVLEGMCLDEDLKRAECLLEEMISTGLRPNVDIYYRMIEGYINCFRYEDAKRILNRMKERGISPNSSCYDSMIIHLCYCNKMKEAGAYMVEMSEKGLDPEKSTYASLIRAYSKVGNMQEAGRYFKELLNSGMTFSNNMYRYVMNGYFKEGNTVAARSIFKFMLERSDVSNGEAYEFLIQGLASHGRVEEATKLFPEIEKKDLSTFHLATYISVMAGFLESNKMETALYVFDMIVKDSTNLSCLDLNDAYKVAIKGLCKWGDVERARQLLDEASAKPNVVSASTYCFMIEDGYCKFGDQMEAFRLVEEMVKNGKLPDTYICSSIVDSCLKQGKIEEAFWFAHEMVEKALVVPKFARSELDADDVWSLGAKCNYAFYQSQVRLF